MPSATVQYRDYVFSITGRPHFGRKVKYESDVPDTPAVRGKVTYTVQHVFLEETFADNQARYAALRTVLTNPEGMLYIADENGTQLINQLVRVDDADLPPQWGQHLAEVTVTFVATENLSGGSAINATYTPVGGAGISLPNVISWKESIRTARYANVVSNRKETVGSVLASGRVRSDPTQTSVQRRAYLQGIENSIKAGADSKEGTLVYGAFNRVINVDTLETDLHDGSDYLDWSISCSYLRFPTDEFAEADFTVKARDDLERQERQTTVSGTIKADDEAGARTRAAAIIDSYTSGRTLRGKEMDAHLVTGVDGDAFLELTFSADFREILTGLAESWSMTISDKDDLKSGQLLTSYAGKVTAHNTATALAKARDLGDAKYPIRESSTETVATASISGDIWMVEVTFSYDYLRKGAKQYAEVTSETDNQTFGNNVTTVSGFAVAPTESAAYDLGRSFKPGGIIRSEKEGSSTLNAGSGNPQHNRVDFSYTAHVAKASGSIQYQVRTAIDYRALETAKTYSGTAWADTESAADTLIDALISGVTGKRGSDDRTSQFDKSTALAFMSRAFTIGFATPLADDSYGDGGIIEASYSLESTYSVNATVITPIPFGTPHVQTAVGTTPGLQVASGSATALTLSAARTWARARIPSGGYADPAREKEDTIFMTGTTVKAYKVDFTYAKRFTVLSF